MLKHLALPLGLLLLLTVPMACTEKEQTSLGMDLQDPFTLYEGIRDTAYMTACTIFDDSLWTAGYEYGIFGDYEDAVFGKAEAVVYSQIAIPTTTGINLSDEVVIDSVVMTLVIDTLYPSVPDSTPVPLHVIIKQLDEPMMDSSYRMTLSSQHLKESDVCFFDGEVTYYADSLRLRMNESIYPVLKQKDCSTEEFLKIVKGFSLRLAEGSDRMVTVDFSSSETRLTLYYHTPMVESLVYTFVINSETGHCMHFNHDYSGTVLAPIADGTADSLEGSQSLYLEPLGGTRVRLNLQPFLNNFRKAHPWAVVHYAELQLPVSDVDDTKRPLRLLAGRNHAQGPMTMVTDADFTVNPYTYGGFGGYYNKEKGYYLMRVTRHLQELLRSGVDYGTELYIDARRSTAYRTVLNGTATANPVKVVFVYSEKNGQ